MMKKNLLLLLSISLILSCSKQFDTEPGQKQNALLNKKTGIPGFNKLFGGTSEDYLRTVIPGNNGGYVFAGSDGHVWIVKVDDLGNKIWEKTYGGSSNEIAHSITGCEGGYIIVGSTYSTDGDIPATHGDGDGFVLKIDESGNLISQKAFGGSDFDELVKIHPAENGNFILVGHSNSVDGNFNTNHGASDMLVIKIDASLNQEWQKTLGGSGSESGASAIASRDGGYFVSGYTDSHDGDVQQNNGALDFWVVKLSVAGEIIWEDTYGGSGFDLATSMTGTVDGGCLIAGLTTSSDGDISVRKGGFVDGWMVKIDKDGDINWDKTVGGTGFEQCLFAITTPNSDFLVGGVTTGDDGDFAGNKGATDGWIMRLNKQGKENWTRVTGGTSYDALYSACAGGFKNFVFGGHSESNDGDVSGNHGFTDGWLFSIEDK